MALSLNIFSNAVNSGLNKFTFLDEVKGWTIERKLDHQNNEIKCRASIPLYGTWFSSRIRLNKDDQLVIPSQLKAAELTKETVLETVKNALNDCRKGLIYLPEK